MYALHRKTGLNKEYFVNISLQFKHVCSYLSSAFTSNKDIRRLYFIPKGFIRPRKLVFKLSCTVPCVCKFIYIEWERIGH